MTMRDKRRRSWTPLGLDKITQWLVSRGILITTNAGGFDAILSLLVPDLHDDNLRVEDDQSDHAERRLCREQGCCKVALEHSSGMRIKRRIESQGPSAPRILQNQPLFCGVGVEETVAVIGSWDPFVEFFPDSSFLIGE